MAANTLRMHGVGVAHGVIVGGSADLMALAAAVDFVPIFQVVVAGGTVKIVIFGVHLMREKYIPCTPGEEQTDRFIWSGGLKGRVTHGSQPQQNQPEPHGQLPFVFWAHL